MLESEFKAALTEELWPDDFLGGSLVSIDDACRVYARFSKDIEDRAVYALMGVCGMHDGGMCLDGGVCDETCARVARFRKLMLG